MLLISYLIPNPKTNLNHIHANHIGNEVYRRTDVSTANEYCRAVSKLCSCASTEHTKQSPWIDGFSHPQANSPDAIAPPSYTCRVDIEIWLSVGPSVLGPIWTRRGRVYWFGYSFRSPLASLAPYPYRAIHYPTPHGQPNVIQPLLRQ